MARSSASKSTGPARIRMVMIDAELPEGADIGQITQAIQNALKPPNPPQRVSNGSTKAIAHEPQETHTEIEAEDDENVIDGNAAAAPRVTPRAKRTPAKTPDIVELDMHEPLSLADFAGRKDSRSQHKKYLICAAWLKEHRGIDNVTDDHIYTCFRSLEWSTSIGDFAQPLRELKGRKLMTQPAKGEYAINHIGLDYVTKLGTNGAA